ncbi:MAG: AbrB/MazE/SpoVT family DNA-binding domain-containing protein [Sphingomonadaceae bacterium]|nr:AbrB/MazE/SpoVT family DNA-binding domain-containing protein [Sphingomonadaceae bacterium]
MNMETRLSAKGQVVIPKDVRERMGLSVGEAFDVVERENEVILRRKNGRRATPATQAVADAVREIRSFYRYEGPPLSLEAIDKAVELAMAKKFRRKFGFK